MYPSSMHLCDCRNLKVGEVRDAIMDLKLKTVAEVTEETEAGCCCKSCIDSSHEAGRDVYIVDLLKEAWGK